MHIHTQDEVTPGQRRHSLVYTASTVPGTLYLYGIGQYAVYNSLVYTAMQKLNARTVSAMYYDA